MTYDKSYYTGRGYHYYDDFPVHRIRAARLVALFSPRSVLDVGCAFGYIVKYLKQMGVKACGCDISEYAEERARKIIPGRFKRCDIREPLPYKDKQFDLLYCEGVLEHIEEGAVGAIMAEFERVAYRRVLQVSFVEHADADKEEGHINLKDYNWWFDRMPMQTYLAMQSSTDTNYVWVFKG